MKHLISTDVAKSRIAGWIASNPIPVETGNSWTEKRLAIEFGGHLYIVENGQVFQCAHCGHYDPQWKSTEILTYFDELFGIKPVEIEIVCSVAVKDA